jgi:hypothetical protein
MDCGKAERQNRAPEPTIANIGQFPVGDGQLNSS